MCWFQVWGLGFKFRVANKHLPTFSGSLGLRVVGFQAAARSRIYSPPSFEEWHRCGLAGTTM